MNRNILSAIMTTILSWVRTANAQIIFIDNFEADADAFAERYGTNIHVAAVYDGKLNDGGETFNLLLDTVPLVAFTYNDKSPWPESPAGDGPSLVLRNPSTGPSRRGPEHPFA